MPLPHLDRPFDYAVPEPMAAAARPGVRVRVRFAGQDVDGWVLERAAATDHPGQLAPLRRVVSPEPVLTPELLALARAVADRYAGTLGDVLRLAVPPRHARAEQALGPAPAPGAAAAAPPVGVVPPDPRTGPWADHPAAGAFLSRLAAGESPRAVWTALPGPGWTTAIAQAVTATVASGRGAVVVVPDRRDADVVQAAVTAELTAALGPGPGAATSAEALVARLEADLGPAARWTAYLRLLRGEALVAVGTRACAFAPVRRLGLVAIWDDGDDQHADQRAPYPHAREVLCLRAEQSGAGALIGAWSRSVEAAGLLEHGWARPVVASRAVQRERWPRVAVAADGREDDDPAARAARMPPAAWRALQDGLTRGPVLVQVVRSGYLPGLSCQTCRQPARCPHCRGPVTLRPGEASTGGEGTTATTATGATTATAATGAAAGAAVPAVAAVPECGWCGRALAGWTCPVCQGHRLRARSVGVDRTAEELGRAFPRAGIVVSRADRHLPRIPAGRTVVLATAGVEPAADGGYAAAVLLDGDVLLERPDLRSGEEALRRWRAATALVRPASERGLVVVCADPGAPAVQALVRSDPAGFAERELAERTELQLPPAAAVATLDGPPAAVRSMLDLLRLPEGTAVLGPVPHEPVRAGPGSGAAAGPDESEAVAVPVVPPVPAAPSAPRLLDLPGSLPFEALPAAVAPGEPGGVPVRVVLRGPRELGAPLARALRDAAAVRSARRDPGTVRVQIDPRDLG